MNARIVKIIFYKEMLDTLRDKRTLLAMVVIPIVLYPVLVIAMTQVTLLQMSRLEETPSRITIDAGEQVQLQEWLMEIPLIDVVESDDPETDLQTGDLDAIVVAEGDIDQTLGTGGTVPIRLDYDMTESASREAVERLSVGLALKRKELLAARLEAKGLEEEFARPLQIERENVAPPAKAAGSVLGTILPLLLVLMLGVGAFYPAIDLTAGEKERGTFETLLSTPTSKLEIVTGKFFTVFVLCMITGLLNLASMTVTLVFQFSQLLAQADRYGADFTFDTLSISPQNVLAIFLLLIPLAFFISAFMMTVAVFARNFKEAQNYVTPFFIVILLPAMASAVPDMELTAVTSLIPIANVSLLFRDLMTDQATLEMTFIVFVCTAIYAGLALVIATWIFQREEVILSGEGGIPLTLNRSQFQPQDEPGPGFAFGLFTVVMLLIFYIGAYVQMKNIPVGLMITEYALILIPVVCLLWFVRIDIPKALNLHVPRVGTAFGGAVIAFAWVPLIIQAGVWHDRVLPAPDEFEELLEPLFAIGETLPGLALLLFIFGVSPAICEEALFRGAMLSSLKKRLPGWAVILIIGVAFGLFHMSIYRFAITGLSGAMLTYLALRSGSILPACFAHFVLNGSVVLIQTGHVPARVTEYFEGLELESSGLPPVVLGAALIVFVIGIVIVEISARRANSVES